jgi:hypothetical protein
MVGQLAFGSHGQLGGLTHQFARLSKSFLPRLPGGKAANAPFVEVLFGYGRATEVPRQPAVSMWRVCKSRFLPA